MNFQPTGYLSGKTPSFTCQAHPSFSYCLYVPQAQPVQSLLVAVHDTMRGHTALRDLFIDHAERTGALVLAPLFPGSLADPIELDRYKYLRAGEVRYDEALLAMVSEVVERYGVNGDRFRLFGFSGGAHFVHRFLYVWPERVSSAVVAAPGSVTLPVSQYTWWAGLADFEERFGHPVNWAALRDISVHLVAGALDTNTSGTVQSPDHPYWVDGAEAAGSNRVERTRSLREHLVRVGVEASYEEIPSAGHEVAPVAGAAIRFLEGNSPLPALAA